MLSIVLAVLVTLQKSDFFSSISFKWAGISFKNKVFNQTALILVQQLIAAVMILLDIKD